MNLAQCLTKLSGLFSKEERAEIEAATAGKGDLVVLSMVAGMAADARYEEQRIVALIGEAQERATTVEQEPAPRATTVEQAKPDLDSRHQLNVDDKAGMDEVSDADADPLIKRLTSQQDNGDILKALPPRARQIVAAALNDLFRLGLPRHLFNDLSGIYMQETNGDGTYYWQRKGIGLHRRLLVEVASGDKLAARALRGVLAHELGHHVDEGPDHFYSSESPAFEIAVGSVSGERVAVGGIIREAFDAYLYGSKELRGYLSYPLYAWTTDPDVDRATQQIKMETFAQLQRLYYTNPRMMRAELPKSYQLFEEIHHAWQSEAGRRAPGLAVQQALRAPRADGRAAVRAAGGNRPAHQGGAGVGRAGAGLGGAALGQRGAQGLAVEESRGGAVPQVRADRERGRPDQVTHAELRGDGRDFTAFFADATRGGRKPNTGRTYTPVLDIGHAADFSREYAQHRGNFDDHIATSIPGFREVQQAVGHAIAKAYAGGGRVLDVGASEGSFIKAISAVTGGKVETVGLDPNPAMAQFFAEHSQVPGASYEMAAFGAQEDAGTTAWTEDDGTEIRYYSPSGKFDVVHEAMTFQFISNARAPQVARVKELLSPSGVALFEEKFIPPPAEFDVNEAKKDEYKARYYSQDELARKKKDVLERGQEAAAAAEQEKEAKFVGMHKLMVSPAEFEGVLADNFKHVIQYWDSGNFKGYAASDDANALRELVRQMGNLDSEYATVSTPRQVADAIRGRGKPDALNMVAGSRSDAKLSDFAPGRVGNILKKKNWAILTAENPSARQLPDAMNAKRNARLEADLAAAGYEFEKVVGKYGGNDEHSYIVVGITPEQANALRDKYGQDASLTRNGLEHSDGSVTPAVGAVEHTATPSDFFTRVPSTGSMFSVELDFAKRSAPTRVPAELTKVLTSDEIAVLSQGRGRVAKLIATMNELPPTADFKHAALAGKAARGWYRKSRLAVEAIFGADAPRFISLMAALSPQTDVRGNFYNAARVWHAWVRAGRTTDRERLQRIYDENLLTDAGLEDGKSAMTAWSGNATRALTTATPETTPLSGPKVESFRRNLLGHDNEVTNDRHNAAFGGIPQEEFKGYKTKGDALSGKGPGYIAFSARVRQAARELSKEGDRWSPAEVQETLWSFWKALYDLATAKGETRSALQLLRDGALTHEMVRRVPHLGSFFNEQEYAQIARAGRRGDAATAGADRAGAYAEPGDALETGPIAATPATERIARRADRLIAARARLEALKAEIKSQDAQLEEAGFSRAAEMRALDDEIARIEADAEGGAHAPSKPDALDANEPAPLWYSALSRAVEQAPFSKAGTMPAGQLRMWLAANASKFSVKKDEIEWSGINDWLATQEGKVSRDDVSSFLGQNGVRVEETVLGERALPEGFKEVIVLGGGYKIVGHGIEAYGESPLMAAINAQEKLVRQGAQWQKNGDNEKAQRFFNRAEELTLWIEAYEGKGEATDTKFPGYTLPGGKNYREILLRLPTNQEDAGRYDLPADHTVYQPDPDNYPYMWMHIDGEGNQIGPDFGVHPNTVAAAVRFAADRLHGGGRPNQQGGAFRSSHFDQTNILAHVRFNERTDAEGRRVLFIEEIQSDWAQKGRKSGFAGSAHDANAGPSNEELIRTGQWIAPGTRQKGGGVPNAPFVGRTEAWVALALKRMIRYAVDNNFDAVAWTTGEQQADRYDLSKHIDTIRYRKDGENSYQITALKGGDVLITKSKLSASDLADTIGKEAADKIVNGRSDGKVGTLSGIDLKVGGEGMRAFYDKIVTNVANDILKKLGGGAVASVRVGRDRDSVKHSIKEREIGGFTARVDDEAANFAEWDDANAWVNNRLGKAQPGFYLTDSMRGAASKPMALFAQEGREVADAANHKPDALDFSAGSARSQVTHAVSDLLTTSKSFNLWDRTVGTQYHKANKATADPMFKRVYDGVQRFMNDASQLMMDASELAPDLLPRLDKLRDVFRLGPNKADMRQVADAVFDGTINDVVYSDADLRGRGLTDHQIGLYRQARAAIDKSLTDMTTSEAIKEARGLLPDAVLAQARDAGNPWIVVDGLANIPQKTAVQQQVYDQLRKRVAKIEDMKRQGYAPLQRFGRYTVTVQNSDGSTALFTLHESEREANAFARSVGETLQPGQGVSQGVLSQEAWKVFQGVSPDTLEIFADALGASDKELMQEYLKLAVNNRSVLKRMIQRKKIPGFQDDIQRTLAQFITSNSRAASRNYHWGDILKDTQLIPKERGDVKDEAIRLTQYVQEPGKEAGALRGLLFVQFLGGSIASAVTNATQPVMMTFPWLAQYGGAIKAAARLTEAGAVAAGKTPAEPALQAALARATKEGIVDPHEVAGLYAESIRNFGAQPAIRRALKVWGSLFSLAEAFNRRITFVAAYRTAVAESIADPYDFAVRAIAETQGVYNRGNRPNWARGAVGATLFTFKQYSIAYMEFLARLPRKERALALAVLVLAAGLQGLPGADDLEDVIDTIAESLGYSFNSKKQLREWAASTLGNESWANFAVHGFSGIPGVPLDMQARLGLQNLIPGTAILKRSETDKSRDVLEFFGPAGSQLKSTVEAFTAAQAGDKGAVASSLVPLAVRNAMKGMDMAQTGFYRDDQGRRVIDVAAYEAAIKAIGFQPRRVAEQSRVVQDAQQDINLHRDVEARLVGKMARAIVEHDEDSLQQARAELVAWNRRNPGSIIQITPQQVRQRAQKMMQTREVRFIKSAPRELRGHIAEELRG